MIQGRLDLQVKVAGVRVDLAALEACLAALPGVAEAAALLPTAPAAPTWQAAASLPTGSAEQQRGAGAPPPQALATFLVPSPDSLADWPPLPWADPSAAASGGAGAAPLPPAVLLPRTHPAWRRVHTHVASRLPAAAAPAIVALAPSLPRGAAGKLLRPALETLLLHASASASTSHPAAALLSPSGTNHTAPPVDTHPEQPPPWSEAAVMRAVAHALHEGSGAALPPLPLKPTDDYVALGLTSLQAAAVAVALRCEPALVLAARSARALAALLRRGPPAAAGDVNGSHSEAPKDGQQRGRALREEGGAAVAAKRARVGSPERAPRPLAVPDAARAAEEEAPGGASGQLEAALRGATALVVHVAGGASRRHQLPAGPCLADAEAATAPPDSGIIAAPPGPGVAGTPVAGPLASQARVKGAWRQPLGRCVDAAPVVVHVLSGPAAAAQQDDAGSSAATPSGVAAVGSGRQAERGSGGVAVVLAASHDGDVAAFDARSGRRCWHARLPSRVEAGLAVCHAPHPPSRGAAVAPAAAARGCGAYVVAAAGDGRLHSLELASGRALGSVELGGEPKARPVVDPWRCDVVWATSHGRRVVAARGPALQPVCRCGALCCFACH